MMLTSTVVPQFIWTFIAILFFLPVIFHIGVSDALAFGYAGVAILASVIMYVASRRMRDRQPPVSN
jgi:hypothetical protein